MPSAPNCATAMPIETKEAGVMEIFDDERRMLNWTKVWKGTAASDNAHCDASRMGERSQKREIRQADRCEQEPPHDGKQPAVHEGAHQRVVARQTQERPDGKGQLKAQNDLAGHQHATHAT